MRNDTLKTPAEKLGRSIQKPPVLTASAAKKFRSFTTPAAKILPAYNIPRYTDITKTRDLTHINPLYVPKESINNHTFNIMNVSCSTEVDVSMPDSNTNVPSFQAMSTPMASFSPLLQRIEQAIDEKLAGFMTSFRNQTTIDLETIALRQQMKNSFRISIAEVKQPLNIEETFLV